MARNAVAGHMGEAYPKPTSIPQGCPLSMMIVALITRPWIQLIKRTGACPIVLADDIMLYSVGPQHEQKLMAAYNVTHQYLADLGAKLAPTKSATFSTATNTRKRLRI